MDHDVYQVLFALCCVIIFRGLVTEESDAPFPPVFYQSVNTIPVTAYLLTIYQLPWTSKYTNTINSSTLFIAQMSSDHDPFHLLYVGDYTTQVNRHFNEAL